MLLFTKPDETWESVTMLGPLSPTTEKTGFPSPPELLLQVKSLAV